MTYVRPLEGCREIQGNTALRQRTLWSVPASVGLAITLDEALDPTRRRDHRPTGGAHPGWAHQAWSDRDFLRRPSGNDGSTDSTRLRDFSLLRPISERL